MMHRTGTEASQLSAENEIKGWRTTQQVDIKGETVNLIGSDKVIKSFPIVSSKWH